MGIAIYISHIDMMVARCSMISGSLNLSDAISFRDLDVTLVSTPVVF